MELAPTPGTARWWLFTTAAVAMLGLTFLLTRKGDLFGEDPPPTELWVGRADPGGGWMASFPSEPELIDSTEAGVATSALESQVGDDLFVGTTTYAGETAAFDLDLAVSAVVKTSAELIEPAFDQSATIGQLAVDPVVFGTSEARRYATTISFGSDEVALSGLLTFSDGKMISIQAFDVDADDPASADHFISSAEPTGL